MRMIACKASIQISNGGSVPATHLKLVVLIPLDIISNKTFNIENISLSNIGPRILEAKMPRFIHGDGSLTTINIGMEGKSNKIYRNYALMLYMIKVVLEELYKTSHFCRSA